VTMSKVTGIGGVFLKAKDPKALYAWYEQHLGVLRAEHGAFQFPGSAVPGYTLLTFFPADSAYFGASGQRAMLNLCVDDLDSVLDSLVAAGAEVDPKRENYGDFGKFGWFADPEGNRVEVWQPSAEASETESGA
jgi:predicted enzyme related to lactoylglutathione lyase